MQTRASSFAEQDNLPSGYSIDRQVVKIFSEKLIPNYILPWSNGTILKANGSGFVFSWNDMMVIMTNAHVISHARYIQVKGFDNHNYTAKPLVYGHECDLALLTVNNKKFWKDLIPLEFHYKDVKRNDRVTAVGFPIGGEEISVTDGTITRKEYQTYTYSQIPLLTANIDAILDKGNSGGPIIFEGKVIGVAHQGSDKIGHIIPLPIIQHFLNGIQERFGPEKLFYTGFPFLGIYIQTMVNPNLRRHFGLNNNLTGVLISKINTLSSAKHVLFEGDVLLKIDGLQIYNNGKIRHPDASDTFLAWNYAVKTHHPDEIVNLLILRDKKILSIDIELSQIIDYAELPLEFDKFEPDFCYRSGVVIQPLTQNFLNQYSSKHKGIPYEFSAYINEGLDKKNIHEQIVFINTILNSDDTQGYEDFTLKIIHSINGILIKNLWSAIKAFDDCQETHHEVITERNEVMILRKLSEKEDLDLRIQYQIPVPESSQYTKLIYTKKTLQSLFFKSIDHHVENKKVKTIEIANTVMSYLTP